MEKKNRYRNRVGGLTLLRFLLGGLLLLATGVGFVLVRNDHVLHGNEIRGLEEDIVALNQEIEMWELRIAGVQDRQELSRRLRWVQSDLAAIDSSKVIEVVPEERDGLD